MRIFLKNVPKNLPWFCSTGRRCAPLGFPNCQAMVSLQGLIHHAQNAHEIPCLPVDLFQEFDIEQIIISSTAINAQNFARVNWKPVLISLKATAHIFQLRTTFDSAAGDSKIKWAIQDRSEPAGDYVAVMSLVKDSSRVGNRKNNNALSLKFSIFGFLFEFISGLL